MSPITSRLPSKAGVWGLQTPGKPTREGSPAVFGAFISGSVAMVSMGAPLAFAVLPGMQALPLLILLNRINHVFTQLSPAHICIVAAAAYFKVGLWDVIKKTICPAVIFLFFAFAYYHFLSLLV